MRQRASAAMAAVTMVVLVAQQPAPKPQFRKASIHVPPSKCLARHRELS
jgi:hypothetical protein